VSNLPGLGSHNWGSYRRSLGDKQAPDVTLKIVGRKRGRTQDEDVWRRHDRPMTTEDLVRDSVAAILIRAADLQRHITWGYLFTCLALVRDAESLWCRSTVGVVGRIPTAVIYN
jgi:hypothetical protein